MLGNESQGAMLIHGDFITNILQEKGLIIWTSEKDGGDVPVRSVGEEENVEQPPPAVYMLAGGQGYLPGPPHNALFQKKPRAGVPLPSESVL